MKHYKHLVYPYVVWISIMVVMPMILIMLYAFTKEGNAVTDFVFTLDNFKKFFVDGTNLSILLRSLRVAVITTIVCILIGYPAGYFISKCADGVRMRWILLITFPTWINMLVRTYAWVGILDDDGLINSFLRLIGLGPIHMINTEFAVVLGMVYNFLPFMILQIHTSLSKLDRNLITAANDLGADGIQTFLRVTLPLSMSGVVSGITLVFLPAVSSFFIPKLLGGGEYVLIGNLIENYFVTTGDWNFGAAISLIMTIIILISMYFTRKFDYTEEERA